MQHCCKRVAEGVILQNIFESKMKYIIPTLCMAVATTSCIEPEDPHGHNEEELITTMNVELVASGDTLTLSFVDLDGDGGNDPVVSVQDLSASTTYSGTIALLNESVDPVIDIGEEVSEEAEDHQFFYHSTGASTFSYQDADMDGNPVGIAFDLTTDTAGSEDLTFTLRHEPAKDAQDVAGGDITNAGGETDIEVTFSVDIQ